MKKIARPFILLLAFVSFAWAQPSVEAGIDAFIKAEMERQKTPGVSVAVVKGGKPLIVKGYGLANVEHNVPVKPETIFQSGSVGKQFTAFAVMMLVEEGKIGLDDPLSNYLPEVPETWKPLTIRRLLTHTSGLGDYPNDFNLQKDATEAEIFKELQRTSPTFKPGEKWEYSNVAFVTLGVLIRKVSGQFYGDFLAERVFKPLGMTTTRVISEADIVPNRAAGYRLVKGELKNQEWVAPSLNTTADGALYMTSLDLIKWDEALRSGKLLKKSSYDEMWSPVKLTDGRAHPYGFGWAVKKINGKRLVEHGGSWQGFKTFIARYIDHDLTVIAFANLAQANPERLARGIAHIVDPSTKPLAITDPDPKFTANIKDLLAAALEKRADMTRFTPEVQKSLESSGDRVAAFVKTLGPIEKFSLLERTETDTATQYRYRVEYSGMSLNLAVAVDKNGKIAGFSLQPE
jgi:CubicO group peptidase (beta-lactamase class C family)